MFLKCNNFTLPSPSILQMLDEDEDLRDFPVVKNFFCFDRPPQTRAEEFDRVGIKMFSQEN